MIEQPTISQVRLRESFRAVFPGGTAEEKAGIGSVGYLLKIGDYRIEASLTARKVSYADEPGTVSVVFTHHPTGKGRKTVVLEEIKTSNPEDLLIGLRKCKGVLLGIVAAIESVCLDPGPKQSPRSRILED